MLSRYTNMSVKSQSYLYSFGLALTLLGMELTDLWMPMVVGAFIMTGLTVESWIRVAHIIPMHKEMRNLHQQIESLRKQLDARE